MKVMSKQTKLSSEEVLERAKNFFENNSGLKIADETANCCIEFSSNLGFVMVQVQNGPKSREVVVRTQEYEYQIQEFLGKI
jgi:hypothetical protein